MSAVKRAGINRSFSGMPGPAGRPALSRASSTPDFPHDKTDSETTGTRVDQYSSMACRGYVSSLEHKRCAGGTKKLGFAS